FRDHLWGASVQRHPEESASDTDALQFRAFSLTQFFLKFPLDHFSPIYNHMVVDHLSSTFAALSDPTRRSIVDRLTAGPATVMELAAPFSISQQAISKHLAYLENACLIEKQRDGRQNFCAIKPDTIREVAD